MNNKAILKIVVICAAIFLVFGILAAVLAAGTTLSDWTKGDFSFGKGKPFEYHKEESFDLDRITQVNIDTVSTNVVFYQSDSDLEVTLDYSGYTNKETITLETGKNGSIINVKIKYPKTTWFSLNIDITESLLQIGIPADYKESISITGVSSNIKMDNYLDNAFSKIDVDTVSGYAYIYCAQIDVLEYDSVSGDLDVKETLISNIFTNTISGDVEIKNISSEGETINIFTVSGKVLLSYNELSETKIITTSGDVNLDFPENNIIDLDFNSTTGDLTGNYNKNSDGVYVNVATLSGDLEIN